MGWYEKFKYDVDVMARLCYPMPDRDDHEVMDEEREDVWESRQAFSEDRLNQLEEQINELVGSADAGEGVADSSPEPLIDELAQIGSALSALETYRDRLIVYARTLASETVPARTIGRCTDLSHSTIVRMVTPEAIADIAPDVSAAAHTALESGLDPRDDPAFYLRLRLALASVEERA